VQLVGCAHPKRRIARAREPLEIVIALFVLRELDTIVVHPPIRDRQHDGQHIVAELVADALLEHFRRIRLAHAIRDDVMENAGNDGGLVTSVASQNDRDVRRMRQIRQTRALSHLPVVMLGRECERVIDFVRIPGRTHEQRQPNTRR